MTNLKYIRRINEDLNEGTESDLGKEKENQKNINAEIATLQGKISEVDRSKKSYLDKTTEKTKMMKTIADRTIDLARSIQMEADLMLKNAKENPNPEKEVPGATAAPTAPAPGAPK
jgi:ATP/maltotriose-dependent transcriptional regulator MalT